MHSPAKNSNTKEQKIIITFDQSHGKSPCTKQSLSSKMSSQLSFSCEHLLTICFLLSTNLVSQFPLLLQNILILLFGVGASSNAWKSQRRSLKPSFECLGSTFSADQGNSLKLLVHAGIHRLDNTGQRYIRHLMEAPRPYFLLALRNFGCECTNGVASKECFVPGSCSVYQDPPWKLEASCVQMISIRGTVFGKI